MLFPGRMRALTFAENLDKLFSSTCQIRKEEWETPDDKNGPQRGANNTVTEA